MALVVAQNNCKDWVERVAVVGRLAVM